MAINNGQSFRPPLLLLLTMFHHRSQRLGAGQLGGKLKRGLPICVSVWLAP